MWNRWFYNNDRSWRSRSYDKTLTINMCWETWEDFKNDVGIAQNDLSEKIFNIILAYYGNSYTIYDTSSKLGNVLKVKLELGTEKYEKVLQIYDKEIDQLVGYFTERNIYRMGDINEDPENYDKYKTARSTMNAVNDGLGKMERLMNTTHPVFKAVNQIINGIILPYQEKDNYNTYEIQ